MTSRATRLTILSLIALLAASLTVVALAQSESTANVQVRVWQSTGNAESLYISARPVGERWGETTELDMSGLNSRETYRYGDILVTVPLGEPRTIDDSDACTELERTTQETLGMLLLSCTAQFLPFDGHASPAQWDVKGEVVVAGGVQQYTGGYLDGDLERRGVSIYWRNTYDPCGEYGNMLREDWEVFDIQGCSADGKFSTLSKTLTFTIRGFAFVRNSLHDYYFYARVDRGPDSHDLTEQSLIWYALVPTE